MNPIYDLVFSRYPEIEAEINKKVEAKMKGLSSLFIAGDRNEPGLGGEEEVLDALKGVFELGAGAYPGIS